MLAASEVMPGEEPLGRRVFAQPFLVVMFPSTPSALAASQVYSWVFFGWALSQVAASASDRYWVVWAPTETTELGAGETPFGGSARAGPADRAVTVATAAAPVTSLVSMRMFRSSCVRSTRYRTVRASAPVSLMADWLSFPWRRARNKE